MAISGALWVAAGGALHLQRLVSMIAVMAELLAQVDIQRVDLEVDAALAHDVALVFAFLPLKPNRYCATRRICTSSEPSVMR